MLSVILPGAETSPPNYRYARETVTVSLVKQGPAVSVPQLPPASLLWNPDVCFSLGRQMELEVPNVSVLHD